MRRIEDERQRSAMRLAAPQHAWDFETRRHAPPLVPSPRSPTLPRVDLLRRFFIA
jgi:hypothetical protein